MLFFGFWGSVKTVRGAPLYDHRETCAPLILCLHPLGMLTLYIYHTEEGREKGGKGAEKILHTRHDKGTLHNLLFITESNGHTYMQGILEYSQLAKPRTGKTQILSIITARLSKLFVKMPQITVKPEHFVILI